MIDTISGYFGRFRRRVLWLAALLATLGATTDQAAAQGTSGNLPDPISSQELARYADRLNLSDEQRQATERYHETYRTAFAHLRDNEIEAYMSRAGGGGFSFTLDRAKIERDTKELRDLLGKIRTQDRRYFDQLQSLLTDEQLSQLPRIRAARERARYRMGMAMMPGMMNPASRVDLSAMIDELEFDLAIREQLDPLLVQYERRLTASVRDLHENSVNMGMTMFTMLQEEGFDESKLTDPEQSRDAFDAMFRAMNAVQNRLSDQATAVADLNRRTLSTISGQIPAEDAHRLRQRFFQRAYREVIGDGQQVAYRFDSALELKSLTEQQRQAIASLESEYRLERFRLDEQFMDAIDEQRSGGLMINPTPEQQDRQERQEAAMDALRDRRTALNERFMLALDGLLGEDLAGRVARGAAKRLQNDADGAGQRQVQQVMIMAVAEDGGGGGGAPEISTFSSTFEIDPEEANDPFANRSQAPPAISSRDASQYARTLGLSDDQRSVVAALHEDYLQGYALVESNQIKSMREAEQALWKNNDETGETTAPSSSDIDSAFALRRGARTAVETIDGKFFDDVSLVIDDPEAIERLRLRRQRQLCAGGTRGNGMFGLMEGGGSGAIISIGGGGGGQESALDLTTVVDDLDLDDDALRLIDPALLEYEQQVTEVFLAHRRASELLEQDMSKMAARFTRDAGPGRHEVAFESDSMEAMESIRAEERDTKARILELNRTTRDRLMEMLDTGTAEALSRAYDRKAYPAVYRDPRWVEPRILSALALEDLSTDQRSRVQNLFASYRAEYDESCQRLVQIESAAADTTVERGMDFDFQGMQQRQRDLQKIKFERNDLNDRTLRALRSLLQTDQVQRLGGLESVAD